MAHALVGLAMTQPVVAPRFTPPAPDSRGSSGLPDDILSEQARRIVMFSGVAAFMWSFGLVMDGWVLPAFVGIDRTAGMGTVWGLPAHANLPSLAEAHARGMVHRDIKPANIFLCRMGAQEAGRPAR